MADPELQGDEQILIRTQGIHVKSISFEAILTNKRIILVDRLKNLLPPKEIPLATIQSIEPGENAIRDLVITLGVITKAGGVRQMVLTFSREGGGNRAAERDKWVRQIRAYLTPSFEQVMRKVIPGIEPQTAGQGYAASPGIRTPPAPSMDFSRPPPMSVPPSPERWQAQPTPEPAAESVLGTYCTKCGTKVPNESGFCTKCGARITSPEEYSRAPVAAPGSTSFENTGYQEQSMRTDILPPTVKPEPDPYTPAPAPHRQATPVQPAAALHPTTLNDERKQRTPKLFSPKDLSPTPLVPSSMPTAVPPPPKKPANRKKIFLAAGVIAIILIVAIVGVFVLPKLGSPGAHSSGSSSTAGTVTPTITTTAPSSSSSSSTSTGAPVFVTTQTPSSVPATGVSVSVSYIGGFNGSYSTGGETTSITGSGSRVYQLENATGSVTAIFQKTDSTTTHQLTVGIYNNGQQLAIDNTSAAYGKVTVTASV